MWFWKQTVNFKSNYCFCWSVLVQLAPSLKKKAFFSLFYYFSDTEQNNKIKIFKSYDKLSFLTRVLKTKTVTIYSCGSWCHCFPSLLASARSSCKLLSVRRLFYACLSETAKSSGGGFSWPGTLLKNSLESICLSSSPSCAVGLVAITREVVTTCCMGTREASNTGNLELFPNQFCSRCLFPFILQAFFPQHCLFWIFLWQELPMVAHLRSLSYCMPHTQE